MNAHVPVTSHASRIQRVVSPGGIEAWLVEDYTVPLIALEFAMEGGASQDPKGRAGLANMLASVIDEGAGPYDSAAFHERLDEFAIELNFSADRDQFTGQLKTLIKHRAEAFDMLRLAINEPRFDAEPVERVRAQILAGLRQEINDPDSMAGRAFFSTAFPGHPYANPVRGSLETMPTITRDDLIAMRQACFARDHLKIGVVGAIDAKTLGAALDATFGALPQKAHLKAIPMIVPQGTGMRELIDLDIPQSSVRFGAPGLLRTDPDWVAAVVVNHVLGGGVFSSRLFREVREKRGLAYSVYSQLVPFNHAGLYIGGTSTKNERVKESLDIIGAEIASLAKDGPNEDELSTAKKYLIGSYALRFDTSTKLADQLVRLQVENLGMDYMDRRNGLVAAVTREDATRAAKRLFGEGQFLATIVGRPAGL
jgi:zinc protease